MEETPWYKSWLFWIGMLIAFILATFILPSVECLVYKTGYPPQEQWFTFFYYLKNGCPV